MGVFQIISAGIRGGGEEIMISKCNICLRANIRKVVFILSLAAFLEMGEPFHKNAMHHNRNIATDLGKEPSSKKLLKYKQKQGLRN